MTEKQTTPPQYRYCIGCVNLYISLGHTGYSELTPGTPGDVSCDKGHFDLDDGDAVFPAMLKARMCDDYEEREDAA